MIRLSVTDLESFRYWKGNEDATLDDLIARLTKKDPPTPQMEAGRAFAKVMELATAGSTVSDLVTVDGWSFDFDLDAELRVSPIRELKGEMLVQTPSGPVTLVGMVDGLDGNVVTDQKLTEKIDAERYLDSLQWRAYLLMFNCRKFVYDVWRAIYEDRLVHVVERQQFPFYAYPGIRADVERAVCELAEVVTKHMTIGEDGRAA